MTKKLLGHKTGTKAVDSFSSLSLKISIVISVFNERVHSSHEHGISKHGNIKYLFNCNIDD